MRGAFKEGDRVEVAHAYGWKTGTVVGERFNGGQGGYFDVRMDDDSREPVTFSAGRMRKVSS